MQRSPEGKTIFALASGGARSAVAVIRVSGPGCGLALKAMTLGGEIPERTAALKTLVDPESGEVLDRAIVLRFAKPYSFTGEDMLEFQITGSPAVIRGVLGVLAELRGFHAADPGEFAKRAFEAGKVDLSQVEGLADLIDAETAAQRRFALRNAGGLLRRETERIRTALLQAMAIVEYELDFSDVEEASDLFLDRFRSVVEVVLADIRSALQGAAGGERFREGFVVAIAGAPNVGKSTLMNCIAGRDVSIVSAVPGTTRDIIEVKLDLRGFPITLLDTAGIRVTDDPVESEGVAKALRRGSDADLVLWLEESDLEEVPPGFAEQRVILVRTKSDLRGGAGSGSCGDNWFKVSGTTGSGVDSLLAEIGRIASEESERSGFALLTRERHRAAYRGAEAALCRALKHSVFSVEFIAEELRIAAECLGRVSGRVMAEEVLGEIFSRLCVGK
ncbi:MAG: tRNA uridine-5-carboxymethylaminomethyl(34) synthesis GTPase MnmE [Roseiarcus sp.]